VECGEAADKRRVRAAKGEAFEGKAIRGGGRRDDYYAAAFKTRSSAEVSIS
jgi:hypothetical protein